MSAVLPDGFRVDLIERPSGNQISFVSCSTPPVRRADLDRIQFYIPYTSVDARTAASAPADAIWCDVSQSPLSYYGALRSWWAKGADFVVLEHDVVCRPDVVEAFENCPEPWCVFGYADICHPHCMEAWRNELGCTRFRAELIRAVPDALDGTPLGNNGLPITWDWKNLCDGLGNNLRAKNYTHHWHYPAVEHHHRLP